MRLKKHLIHSDLIYLMNQSYPLNLKMLMYLKLQKYHLHLKFLKKLRNRLFH
jgi:hypothetical protein